MYKLYNTFADLPQNYRFLCFKYIKRRSSKTLQADSQFLVLAYFFSSGEVLSVPILHRWAFPTGCSVPDA